jgi:hypothetical protein
MADRRDNSAALLRAARRFDEANRRCAEIILADRHRYEGLPVLWAERFLARMNNHDRDQPRQGAA